MLISIVSAVVILGLLIVVHEAGHFVMAKRCGVRVLRFSIGYPPKVLAFRRGETEYALSATPFGGYVRMLGDEIGDEPGPGDSEILLRETGLDLIESANARGLSTGTDPDRQLLEVAQRATPQAGGAIAVLGRAPTPLESRLLAEVGRLGSAPEAIKMLAEARPPELAETLKARSFPTQSVLKRILIVIAGPLANFVFAPIALAVVFMYGVPELLPVLGQAKAGMPAAQAGLHSGDRILSIDGQPTRSWNELSQKVRGGDGQPLRIEYERRDQNGNVTHETIVLKPARDGGATGNWVIGVLPRGDSITRRLDPLTASTRAVVETGKITAMLVAGIAEIVRGTTPIREALGGPIMIAQLAGQQAHQGFANVAIFTVMLSVELAIINLIPVPMLDGGHLFFFLVECVRGKPVEVRHREMAQRVGLVVIVALMAFVIFNDISRIVQG
jgi:regulator of sigma E protease